MPSSSRYNGSTGFGRYSPLGGAGEGVQEVHLNCRLWSCRVAQSIGLVEGIPNLVSELNAVEYSLNGPQRIPYIPYGMHGSKGVNGLRKEPQLRPSRGRKLGGVGAYWAQLMCLSSLPWQSRGWRRAPERKSTGAPAGCPTDWPGGAPWVWPRRAGARSVEPR
jgi:hypothetical protein